jgi:teichuronic acid exporter
MISVKSAVAWSGAEILARQGTQFLLSMIMARLIAPDEFGVIALLTLFAAMAGSFVDAGFASALVQRRDVSREDESSVFWFNLTMAAAIALLFGYSGRWLAAFYGEAQLVALTWAMGLNIFLGAFIAVPNALLAKKLDFKTQIRATVARIGFGGAAGIWFGWQGYGAWAIAIQTVTMTGANVVAIWLLFSWRPSFIFRIASLKRLGSFGSFMFLSVLVDILGERLYTVVIGKLYSPLELGFYNRGVVTKDFAQGSIGSLIASIAFPLFSSLGNDRAQLRKQIGRALRLSMALNIPVMLGLAVTADDVIAVLYGERWLPAAPALQALSFVGLLLPLQTVNNNLLKGLGRSRLFFFLLVAIKILLVVVVIAAARFSVMAVAWGTVFCAFAGFLINASYTRHFLGYGPVEQLRDIAPYLATGLAMVAVIFGIRHGFADRPSVLRLATEVVIGATFYLGILWLLRMEAFLVGLTLVRSVLSRRSTDALSP